MRRPRLIPATCSEAALARCAGLDVPLPEGERDLPLEVSSEELGRVIGRSGRQVRAMLAQGYLQRGPSGGVWMPPIIAAGLAQAALAHARRCAETQARDE